MDTQLDCPGSAFYKFGKDLVGTGVRIRLRMQGMSMHPFIRDGEVVEIAPVSLMQVAVGDVVFFRSGDGLLAHRVCSRQMRAQQIYFVTRGDGSAGVDDCLLDEANLVGRVEIVFRHGRAVRLDEGLSGFFGRFSAQSEWARSTIRWVARLGLFFERRIGPRRSSRDMACLAEVDVEG